MRRISTDAEWLDSGTLIIDADGVPVELPTPEAGLVLTSPDGARWRVTVSNSGEIITTAT